MVSQQQCKSSCYIRRENLTLQQPYHGNDSVTVGNGGGLQIANTGSSLFSTPKSNFYLHNILHCPQASSNLLSIQKFCRDNHCYFILTSNYFLIKDMRTKEILLQGPSEAGLYPIYFKQLQSNKVKSKAVFLSSPAFLSRFTAFLGVRAPDECCLVLNRTPLFMFVKPLAVLLSNMLVCFSVFWCCRSLR